jgi:hypothetical protein
LDFSFFVARSGCGDFWELWVRVLNYGEDFGPPHFECYHVAECPADNVRACNAAEAMIRATWQGDDPWGWIARCIGVLSNGILSADRLYSMIEEASAARDSRL